MKTHFTSLLAISALICASGLAMPASAFAQDGIVQLADFFSGFDYSSSKFDDTIAMLFVGLFSFRLAGRAVWLLPCAFIGIMFVASGMGAAGAAALLKSGASLSLILFGMIIAFNIKIPFNAALSFVGIFALLHGQTLGEEMQGNAGCIAYLSGFVAATVLLHALGAALAWTIAKTDDGWGPIDGRTNGRIAAPSGFGVGAGVF